jgi:inosine-uridine nucleoside N-ribohydrolase
MINTAQKLVWIDTDITIGKRQKLFSFCDVDDGYALAAMLRAAEVEVVGVSSTLGNTKDISVSTEVARSFISRFGPTRLLVNQGSPLPLQQRSETDPLPDAVQAMADALKENRLTLLCLGAVTNIGLLLQHFPEIIEQINEIVCVAGRRSIGQHFFSGHWQPEPFRDLNFEFDPEAFELLLKSTVPLTLATSIIAACCDRCPPPVTTIFFGK